MVFLHFSIHLSSIFSDSILILPYFVKCVYQIALRIDCQTLTSRSLGSLSPAFIVPLKISFSIFSFSSSLPVIFSPEGRPLCQPFRPLSRHTNSPRPYVTRILRQRSKCAKRPDLFPDLIPALPEGQQLTVPPVIRRSVKTDKSRRVRIGGELRHEQKHFLPFSPGLFRK